MQYDFADIALEWLRYEPRLRRGVVTFDQAHRARLINGFARRLERMFILERIDDLRHSIDDFFWEYDSIVDWWRAVLETRRIAIRFEGAEPLVQHDAFLAWRWLVTQVEPDTLIALAYVRRYHKVPDPAELRNWGTVVGSDHHGIRRLFTADEYNIHDTHTHLEGCEVVADLWRRIMRGELSPCALPAYGGREIETLASDSEAALELVRERHWIGEAAVSFHALYDQFQPPTTRQVTRATEFLSNISASLWTERYMLSASWLYFTEATSSSPDRSDDQMTHAIDRYLVAKTMFWRRHVQGVESNPGFTNFRRHFDRSKVLALSRRSQRLRRERYQRFTQFATEQRGVAGVEIRIAPFDSVRDYVRFFRDYRKHASEFVSGGREREASRLSFVVHFIRYRADKPAESDQLQAPRVDANEIRMQMDRQSAVLQRFRMEYPGLATDIVGIDVANYERLNSVHLFAPYLNLLRAIDPYFGRPASRMLSAGDESRYLRHWQSLVRQDLDLSPATYPLLGLTYHAGEDFFHPLSGMRAIYEVRRTCHMREGDRIGHGLALGVDLPAFNRQYGRHAIIPRGEALDVLVWLRRRARALQAVDPRTIRLFDDDIEEICESIYDRSFSHAALYRAQRERSRALLPDPRQRRGVRTASDSGLWFDEQVRTLLHLEDPELFQLVL